MSFKIALSVFGSAVAWGILYFLRDFLSMPGWAVLVIGVYWGLSLTLVVWLHIIRRRAGKDLSSASSFWAGLFAPFTVPTEVCMSISGTVLAIAFFYAIRTAVSPAWLDVPFWLVAAVWAIGLMGLVKDQLRFFKADLMGECVSERLTGAQSFVFGILAPLTLMT